VALLLAREPEPAVSLLDFFLSRQNTDKNEHSKKEDPGTDNQRVEAR
jgi:hypothetical protein